MTISARRSPRVKLPPREVFINSCLFELRRNQGFTPMALRHAQKTLELAYDRLREEWWHAEDRPA